MMKRGRECFRIGRGVNSNPKCNTEASAENFRWRSIGEAFARSIIEGTDDFGKLRCPDAGEIGGFREIVAQQPVGVLVGASLPGCGTVEKGRESFLDGRKMLRPRKEVAHLEGSGQGGNSIPPARCVVNEAARVRTACSFGTTRNSKKGVGALFVQGSKGASLIENADSSVEG
jgi:hypothetical protein